MLSRPHPRPSISGVIKELDIKGVPINPQNAEWIPGGSSSGSASAVGGNLLDFALGTDTGGSVRVPSSYCGIYGMRPTHGRISLEGVAPLAPSLDTVGWFARDSKTLGLVGEVLLKSKSSEWIPRRIIIAADLYDFVSEEMKWVVDRLAARLKSNGAEEIRINILPTGLEHLFQNFVAHQGYQAWRCHGEWISSVHPNFAPDIAQRFKTASTITESQFKDSEAYRQSLRQHLTDMLGDQALILLPSAISSPSHKDDSYEDLGRNRNNLYLTAVASLSGCPQISIPIFHEKLNAKLGASVLGPPGADEKLLALISNLARGD